MTKKTEPYTLFVSSDIHSAYTEWMNALKQKGFNIKDKNHKILICGDLFDRMFEAVECFEFIQQMIKEDRCIYVKGNHESLLFDCLQSMIKGNVGLHHFQNGTVDTIQQFVKQRNFNLAHEMNWRIENLLSSEISEVYDIMRPVLDLITDHAVNYFSFTGDFEGEKEFIATHGWIPNDNIKSWKKLPQTKWEKAMWENGMARWSQGYIIPGKTIIVGHWGVSYGHNRFEGLPEWPKRGSNGWLNSFKPFYGKGIIALDSTVAYSGVVNVIKIENCKELKEN